MRLFLYGTLLAGAGARAEALHRLLEPGTAAWTRGWLHAVPDPDGWYPALRPDPAGPRVRGMVHHTAAGFTPADLAALDAYEDAGPATAGNGEYRRAALPVVLVPTGARIAAEAWCYDRPLPAGSVRVRGGDFAAWLRATGRRSFAG